MICLPMIPWHKPLGPRLLASGIAKSQAPRSKQAEQQERGARGKKRKRRRGRVWAVVANTCPCLTSLRQAAQQGRYDRRRFAPKPYCMVQSQSSSGQEVIP